MMEIAGHLDSSSPEESWIAGGESLAKRPIG
jgi:hypothetical protein